MLINSCNVLVSGGLSASVQLCLFSYYISPSIFALKHFVDGPHSIKGRVGNAALSNKLILEFPYRAQPFSTTWNNILLFNSSAEK